MAGKGQGRGSRESKVAPAPEANIELQTFIQVSLCVHQIHIIMLTVCSKLFQGFNFSLFYCLIQKRKGLNNFNIAGEKHNTEDHGGSGHPIEPPRETTHGFFSHSGQNGQSMHPSTFDSSLNMNACSSHHKNGKDRRLRETYTHCTASMLSRFSNSVAARGASRFDDVIETSVNPHWPEERINGRYGHLDNGASSEKHTLSHHLVDRSRSSHKKDPQPLGKQSTTVRYQLK